MARILAAVLIALMMAGCAAQAAPTPSGPGYVSRLPSIAVPTATVDTGPTWTPAPTRMPDPTATVEPTRTPAPTKAPVAPAASEAASLEVVSVTASRQSQKYWQVDGFVKNVSGQPIKNVSAIVILILIDPIDPKNIKPVSSVEVMLSYNPILPGQISPFKAMVVDSPKYDAGYAEFKQIGGGTLWTDKANVEHSVFVLME